VKHDSVAGQDILRNLSFAFSERASGSGRHQTYGFGVTPRVYDSGFAAEPLRAARRPLSHGNDMVWVSRATLNAASRGSRIEDSGAGVPACGSGTGIVPAPLNCSCDFEPAGGKVRGDDMLCRLSWYSLTLTRRSGYSISTREPPANRTS